MTSLGACFRTYAGRAECLVDVVRSHDCGLDVVELVLNLICHVCLGDLSGLDVLEEEECTVQETGQSSVVSRGARGLKMCCVSEVVVTQVIGDV